MEAGVIVPAGRKLQMGCITSAVIRITEPATHIYLDPDARPGWV